MFAGLSTCDPGNILDSIKAAKQHRVRVSVVGLAAEVYVCRVITDVSFPPVHLQLNPKPASHPRASRRATRSHVRRFYREQ